MLTRSVEWLGWPGEGLQEAEDIGTDSSVPEVWEGRLGGLLMETGRSA